jgi:tetratricopeptide (TPR) repeat protein
MDKAESDFGMALKLNPNSAAAMVEMGQLRLTQKKIPEATALFESALEKDPNSASALLMLTDISMSQKDSAKAIARIQAAIAKSPNNSLFYDDLAGVQLATRDFGGARNSAGKAMQLNPEDLQALQNYSTALTAAGDKDGAIAAWQHWSDAHPKDPNALATMAELIQSKGDLAKAEEYYKKALVLDPTQVLASNNLAYLMLTRGENVDEALTLAQTARRGAPNSPATADTLAWVYYTKGRYASARDLLEDAVKQAQQSAAMQYHLGMAYSKLGDKTQAAAHLKKAQSLPSDPATQKDVSAALAQLG